MKNKVNPRHHLHRSLQSLPVLEMETMMIRGTTVGESQTDQERPLDRVYRVFQWKYRVDDCEPWWRRWYFHLVWLPFARFSYLKVRMVPFERLEPDGSLSWKEDQGYFTEEWQAAQVAARYTYGGYNEVCVNASENTGTCKPRVRFPNSRARGAYVKHGKRLVEMDVAPVERLQQVLVETQSIVDNFRHARQ